MRRIFLPAAAAAFLLAACRDKKPEAPRLDSFPVRAAPAARRDLEETITLVASVKAKDEAVIFSRVPGKLLRNNLKEGDRVRKGGAVALIERDEVGARFEPAPVPSTLDGVVGRVYLDQGQTVTPQTPVALVVDDSELLVRAEIPERYAGRCRAGQDVRLRVDAFPGREFPGTVTRVSPVVDPATRSALLEARLAAAARGPRPGMFGELSLVLGRARAVLAVPVEALAEGARPAVFVVEGGKAFRREVELGLRTEALAEVRKGLNPGESVVNFGIFGLKDGSAVELLPAERAGAR